jgi:BMFP domain-containing protein YqiC
MQSDNRLFDDFVKLMNGAAGTLAGVGREAESGARTRMREWIGGLDFVSRDEFEVVKAMAVAARGRGARGVSEADQGYLRGHFTAH